MANAPLEIRSALLKSETVRRALDPQHAEISEVAHALQSIDALGGLYDALRKTHEAVNPHETPEARAMRYEKQFNSAVGKARELAMAAGEKLDTLAELIDKTAIAEAGLGKPSANDAEIRAALRGMKQSERDKAVSAAFERGDRQVLNAIHGQNPVVWGGTSKPIDQFFSAFIDTQAPEALARREAVNKITEGLNLAADAFTSAAVKWRDPLTAARGFAQEKQYSEAEAALKAALGAAA